MFIERLWAVTEIRVRLTSMRSKPAPNCGQASETGSATTMPIRPHSALGGATPDEGIWSKTALSLIRG